MPKHMCEVCGKPKEKCRVLNMDRAGEIVWICKSCAVAESTN